MPPGSHWIQYSRAPDPMAPEPRDPRTHTADADYPRGGVSDASPTPAPTESSDAHKRTPPRRRRRERGGERERERGEGEQIEGGDCAKCGGRCWKKMGVRRDGG
eukprot:5207744-Pyramimonas_sp.AAC.1